MAPYAQKILFFFCRPCGEYYEKRHPHYRAMNRRKAKRAKKATEAQQEQKTQEDSVRNTQVRASPIRQQDAFLNFERCAGAERIGLGADRYPVLVRAHGTPALVSIWLLCHQNPSSSTVIEGRKNSTNSMHREPVCAIVSHSAKRND
jgi:hypothetical protein